MHKSSTGLVLVLGLAACGSDAPAPGEVRARIAKDLVTIVDAANASRPGAGALTDSAQLTLLTGALARFDGGLASGMTDAMDAELDGAEAARFLNERIFTDGNHAGDGVFNLPASLACENEGRIDPDCAQAFAKLQLRIRVSGGDELRFALQVGPKHDEPLELGLSAKQLSLSVDLDEVEDAVRALAPMLGDELAAYKLAGAMTAKIEVLGAAAAKFSFDIDRDLDVRIAGSSFTSKASNVLALALDGAARSMQLQLGLAETHAKIVGDSDDPIEVDLPGITAGISAAEGQPVKLLFGLQGALRVLAGGQEAVRVELNPDEVIRGGVTGQLANGLLEVSPRFDLRLRTNHNLLGDVEPVYDVSRVLLEGGLRARPDDSVEVVGGKLAIETNPTQYGVTATSGQCVRSSEAFDVDRDAFYTAYSAGACE